MLRVVYLMWLRQMKRYLRTRTRLIVALAQPLLYLMALGLGLSPVYRHTGPLGYRDFIVPGIIAMSVLYTALFSGSEVIWEKQTGFLRQAFVAPVPRFVIMLGRVLGSASVAVLQGTLVVLVCLLVGFRPAVSYTLFLTLPFMLVIAVCFASIGVAIASRLPDYRGFDVVVNFVLLPTFFLSGALYPIDTAPITLQIAAHADPLFYGVEGLRGSLLGTGTAGIATDMVLACLAAASTLVACNYLFSRARM